jgi:hypothetical protein
MEGRSMPERKQGLPRALRLRQGSGNEEAGGREEAPAERGEVVAWEVLVPIVTNPCIIGDVLMFSCMAFVFPAVIVPVAANFLGYVPTRPGLLAFFGLLVIIIAAFDAAYLLFSLAGLGNRFAARFVMNSKGVSMENGRLAKGSASDLSLGQSLSARVYALPPQARVDYRTSKWLPWDRFRKAVPHDGIGVVSLSSGVLPLMRLYCADDATFRKAAGFASARIAAARRH